jgi:hypothetical protein
MAGSGCHGLRRKDGTSAFNPAVVLVFVNSPLDLSVDTFSRADTFSHAMPVVSEARMSTRLVVSV